jgi:hypothetical protein
MIGKHLVTSAKIIVMMITLYFLTSFISCSDSKDIQNDESIVKIINGTEEFKNVVNSAGDRL